MRGFQTFNNKFHCTVVLLSDGDSHSCQMWICKSSAPNHHHKCICFTNAALQLKLWATFPPAPSDKKVMSESPEEGIFFFSSRAGDISQSRPACHTPGDGSCESEPAICDYAGLLESKMKVNIHGLTHSLCRMFFHATMTILLSTKRGGGRCCGKYSLGRSQGERESERVRWPRRCLCVCCKEWEGEKKRHEENKEKQTVVFCRWLLSLHNYNNSMDEKPLFLAFLSCPSHAAASLFPFLTSWDDTC